MGGYYKPTANKNLGNYLVSINKIGSVTKDGKKS